MFDTLKSYHDKDLRLYDSIELSSESFHLV